MPIEKIINNALRFIEAKLSSLGDKIIASMPKNESVDLRSNIDNQTKLLTSVVSRIEKTISKIKDPVFSGKVDVNTKTLEKEITKVNKVISSFKLPTTKEVEISLKKIITELKTSNLKSSKKEFDSMVSAIEILKEEIKENKFPNTFKLDEMQLRALKPQGGGYGGILPARSTIITNVTMTSADTEYSHTFNKSCVSFRMKLRVNNSSFYYSWETGKLKVSGDASSYISIPANWLDSRDGIEYNGKTIYFESGTAGMKMEIEEGIS